MIMSNYTGLCHSELYTNPYLLKGFKKYILQNAVKLSYF